MLDHRDPSAVSPSPTPPPVQTALQPATRNGRDAYNMVTDLGIGANVRWKDNLYQGLFILGCFLLGILTGVLLADVDDRIEGGVVGGLIGMIAGLFISGTFIMIYRGIRHLKGRHD